MTDVTNVAGDNPNFNPQPMAEASAVAPVETAAMPGETPAMPSPEPVAAVEPMPAVEAVVEPVASAPVHVTAVHAAPDHAAPVEVPPPVSQEEVAPLLVATPVMPELPATTSPEIPRTVELDADLEAELSAAMSGATAAMPESTPNAKVITSVDDLVSGTQLKAKVQSINDDSVFVDVGLRCPGMVPLKQFPQGKKPNVGEEFLVHVESYSPEDGVILVNLPRSARKVRGNWDELQQGMIVEAMVLRTNKGGLEVSVSNLRGFLPASQVDLGFVSSMEELVGRKFQVKITEVNPAKRNLVVSRRAVMIEERKELAGQFWQTAEVGQQFTGRVKTLKDYGVFVDIGGVDGFLHIGEMSWSRIKHPGELLQEGQQIEVQVLSLDREKQKIGLGLRQLTQNPWLTAQERYAAGTTVSGKVSRVSEFGAFVELEPGVEGLVHISELEYRRIKRVQEVVDVGQEVQAKVLEVDPGRQRISLSVKALKEKPEEMVKKEAEEAKPYVPKRREPLRGGTSGAGNGGLFGDPGKFER